MTERLDMPDLPLTGGCQCGTIRYRLTGAPVVFYICHCTECQKQSSSGFGESLRVRTADLEIEGSVSTFIRDAASDKSVSCDFCPQCGSRLFHRREGHEALLNIKAGTLDNATWLKPAGHIWTKSKQSWVEIPHGDLEYEGQPENYDALSARWRIMLGG